MRLTFLPGPRYSDGLETPYDDLPSNDPALVMRYPLVWRNPYTGEKMLQVHHLVAAKLYVRTSPDGPETVIDDLKEVRDKLYDLQRPFLQPENVLVAPVEEGDIVVWYNRGLRHSALDYPSTEEYGTRICHQVHIAGSDDPSNPELIQGGPK
jgi:alpha-ketoglutarate-dependent taurine dioxygenase